MKKTVIRILVITLFLVVSASTPVLADGGGGTTPLCPNSPCAR